MINLEVLAGKMGFDGKKVTPDSRKGLLRLSIDSEQDSVKVQWLDRSVEPAVVENEWPAPVVIEAVPSAKTGKVFVVKPLEGEKQFIWIQQQSSNAAGDAAGYTSGSVDNLEALLNQIQMFAQMRSGREAAEVHAQIFGLDEPVQDDQMLVDLHHHDHDRDEDDDEPELDEDQMQALVQQMVSSGMIGADSSEEQVLGAMLMMNPEFQQMALAQFVAMAADYLTATSAGAAVTSATPVSTTVPQNDPPSIRQVSSVITDSLPVLTADESTRSRLLALCPESETDLLSVLRSPQFAETMRSLTEGIYSDQISSLFASLGLDSSELMSGGGSDPFEALCKAMEKKFHKQ